MVTMGKAGLLGHNLGYNLPSSGPPGKSTGGAVDDGRSNSFPPAGVAKEAVSLRITLHDVYILVI